MFAVIVTFEVCDDKASSHLKDEDISCMQRDPLVTHESTSFARVNKEYG